MNSLLILLLAAATAPAVGPSPAMGAATCDEPVYLVTMVDRLDRDKSRVYAEAVRASGIARQHGSQYKIAGAPLEVLEGHWPADRGYAVERYPCRAALDEVRRSTEFQEKLKPLREETGDYTTVVFKALNEK